MKLRDYKNKVLASIALAAIIYLIIGFWSNFGELERTMRDFYWPYIFLMFATATLNFIIRFVKWHFFVKLLKIKIPIYDSWIIFISGFSMAITPGKIGELIKSYLIKKAYNEPVSKTAPMVFADRINDLAGLLIIASVGAMGFDYGKNVLKILSLILISVIVIILARPVFESILSFFSRIKYFSPHIQKISNLYESSYILLKPKYLAITIPISTIAWAFEGLTFYLAILAFGWKIGFLASMFIYSFSMILGAISFIPGGLGLTEGTMVGLMLLLNMTKAQSSATTLIVRIVTLWYAIFLGSLALLVFQKKHGPGSNNNINNN
jgi:glycosyltransferase 2 family protein